MERSTAFNRDVLGAVIAPLEGERVAFRFDEQQLDVHGPGSTPDPVARLPVQSGGSDLCFVWEKTPEAAAGASRAKGRRGGARSGAEDGGGGSGVSVYFRDPDGSLLELIAHR